MLLNCGVGGTLESPLDCKKIQPVYPKGNLSWIFIGRTDVQAEMPIFWPPDANNWLIWKDPDSWKNWRQEEKGMTEDEMLGWHHQLNGHVWISSRSWWWTGKPGVLQSTGPQRVRHDWATELRIWNQPECPWRDEWIKMWYIDKVEYYSAIKGTKLCYL